LNDFGHGYLSTATRERMLEQLESQLRLRTGQLERLLYLDAPEHAILSRLGGEPEPADVVAEYNLGVLVALLRQAETVELTLAEPPHRIGHRIESIGVSNGVEVQVGSRGPRSVLELRGRQDSLGSWVRHGRRVARTVLDLLERTRPSVIDGQANLALRGRRARLRLSAEVLDTLAGLPAPCTGWDEQDPIGRDGVLVEAAQALRTPRERWSFRRHPEPQAWRSGLLLPDLLARHGEERFYLHTVRSTAHAERLAWVSPAATTGEPYVFIGEPASLAPLTEVGARVLAVPRFERAAVVEALRGEFSPGSAGRQSGQAA
jgi:predicted nuclease of restriction endonuclease-like RecB superfamily